MNASQYVLNVKINCQIKSSWVLHAVLISDSEQQVIDLKRNIYTTEQLSKSQLDDFSEV